MRFLYWFVWHFALGFEVCYDCGLGRPRPERRLLVLGYVFLVCPRCKSERYVRDRNERTDESWS